MKRMLYIVLAVILAIGGVVGSMSAYPKQVLAAATLTVTTNSDAGDDATIGANLAADTTDGPGLSLREAINWAGAGDTVTFDGSLSGQTVTLSGTPLTIDKDITLDGDLNDDGTPDITVSGNSTSRVIYTTGLTAAARVEGLTITGGLNTGVSSDGGGMYNAFSSPTIANCTFSNNFANLGGGMYNFQSSPTITNCTFSNNAATTINLTDAAGGGMANLSNSSPTITDCIFSNNTAVDWGGSIMNHTSSPIITNCIFTGNSATNAGGVGTGGGMWNYSSSPTINSCTFSNNTADNGGGMWNYSSSPTITSCNFSGNTASTWGGGIYNTNSSSPNISNCTLSSNTAQNAGGIYNSESTLTITDCNFTANTADGGVINDALGGGMYNYKSTLIITSCAFLDNAATATDTWISLGGGMSNVDSSLSITNCTLFGNTADVGGGIYNDSSSSNITNCTLFGNTADVGGGIYNGNASSPTVTNCIFWGATGGEICNDTSPPLSSLVVTYSDVQGGCAGTGNIDANPLFVNAAGGDFHLRPASPCIDAGNNAVPSLPATDFEGDARILGGTVDMGTDETTYPTITAFTPTSAGIGESVTITGTNFTGATAVKLGGTATSSFTVDSDTQITAVVGSGSSGNITVTTPGGTATSTVNFTYIPPPTITSVNPASAYRGSTWSITIAGTNLTGATTISFGSGITTNSYTVDSSTQITAVIAISGGATLGTRDVSVTTPGGTATLSGGFNVLEVVTYDGPSYYLQMNVLGKRQSFVTSYSGIVEQMVEITSTDGLLTVTIPKGTVARQENGNRLTTFGVSVNENPPPPPENKNIIGLVYNFEPDGATFDPPITLTFTYDPETLPEGVEEEDLVLAFYDEDTGSWIELECVVDTDNHTITALVSHFTNFAIIGKVIPPAAFIVSNLTVEPEQIAPRGVVTITVSLANTGGMEGNYTSILEVNGVGEQTQSISIAAGGTKRVDFTVSREEPGDYMVKIDDLEGSFTVMVPPAQPETPVAKPSPPQPKPPSPPTEPPAPVEEGGINWYIIGAISGFAVLLAILLPIWIRRRRAG